MNPGIVVSLCVFSQAVEVINDYLVFHRMLWLVKEESVQRFYNNEVMQKGNAPLCRQR